MTALATEWSTVSQRSRPLCGCTTVNMNAYPVLQTQICRHWKCSIWLFCPKMLQTVLKTCFFVDSCSDSHKNSASALFRLLHLLTYDNVQIALEHNIFFVYQAFSFWKQSWTMMSVLNERWKNTVLKALISALCKEKAGGKNHLVNSLT